MKVVFCNKLRQREGGCRALRDGQVGTRYLERRVLPPNGTYDHLRIASNDKTGLICFITSPPSKLQSQPDAAEGPVVMRAAVGTSRIRVAMSLTDNIVLLHEQKC